MPQVDGEVATASPATASPAEKQSSSAVLQTLVEGGCESSSCLGESSATAVDFARAVSGVLALER